MNDQYSFDINNFGNDTKYSRKLNRSISQPNIDNFLRKTNLNLSGREIINGYNPYSNNKIASRLKYNNLLTHQQLNDITNEYSNMKSFLNNKIQQLELQQQNQFDSLKNFFNDHDRHSQMKYEERQRNKLLYGIKEQISEEIKKQRERENQNFRNYMDEIEQKRANINVERSRLFDELKYYNHIKRKRKDTNNYRQRYPTPLECPINPYAYMNYPPYYYNMYNNERNNNKDGDLVKLFVLKALMDEDKPPVQQNVQPQYIPIMPPMQPNYMQPPPQPPQPIIIQSPPPNPNVIVQPNTNHKKRSTRSKRTETKYKKTKKKKPRKKTEEEEDDDDDDDDDDEDSSEREVLLKLYDPDDENLNKVIRPQKASANNAKDDDDDGDDDDDDDEDDEDNSKDDDEDDKTNDKADKTNKDDDEESKSEEKKESKANSKSKKSEEPKKEEENKKPEENKS